MTPFQSAVLDIYPPPRLFAVVSWGAAGTSWLARALNAHPDIFCVHAAGTMWKIFAGCPPVDGVEYLRIVGAQGYAHACAGDVHGVSRHTIPALRQEFGDRFRSAVLVRDPLPRLRSQLALMNRLRAFQGWDVSHVDMMARTCGFDPTGWSYDERLQFHAANMLNAIVEETAVGPIFRLEDISRSATSLEALLRHLTAGEVTAPMWWAKHVLESRPVNSHASSVSNVALNISPELLRAVLRPEAIKIYCDLGYQLAL
ncbi:MAG: hypothetical protein KF715_06640 [Candidatus Didemnitutus sp.]|nr:hypothetical protein [Candidatus Didemnitutus sp.]